jgi:hypothetical protein
MKINATLTAVLLGLVILMSGQASNAKTAQKYSVRFYIATSGVDSSGCWAWMTDTTEGHTAYYVRGLGLFHCTYPIAGMTLDGRFAGNSLRRLIEIVGPDEKGKQKISQFRIIELRSIP